MAANTFGTLLTLTTFGESHGEAIGGIIDHVPAGLQVNFQAIQNQMNRRRPGQNQWVSPRNESDEITWLSGIFDGKTTGTPIGFLIPNADKKSVDYEKIKEAYRPSHADFTYDKKYGFRDYRGGGRSSARETAVRVAAGALVEQLLPNVHITAYVSQIGPVKIDSYQNNVTRNLVDQSEIRCPILDVSQQMLELLTDLKQKGDSVGGVIDCIVKGVPAGLGEPVFDKLHAALGRAMLSINAVKGFEIGSGFQAASMFGSAHNDTFLPDGSTATNHSGGIQGGISNGMDICFRVAFKPVATIMQDQKTINAQGEEVVLEAKGRHDPCVVPRAVPIVEAMTALVLADFYLLQKIQLSK